MPLVTSDQPLVPPPSSPTQASSVQLEAQWEPGLHLPGTQASSPPAQPSLARQPEEAATPIGQEGWAGSEEFKCGRNLLQSTLLCPSTRQKEFEIL